MFVVVKLVAAWELTMVLLSNFLLDVGTQVDVEVESVAESHWTVFALEGLFTSMDLLMSFKVGDLM